VDAAAVAIAFMHAYAGEAFVRVLGSPEAVTLKAVVGTNRCLLGFAVDGQNLIVTSAIDNLVKGAAGQAVQNLNLMLGLEETTGLQGLRAFYP
jgi:N-acetyl-gamma-glutamyl-phosphate reductase